MSESNLPPEHWRPLFDAIGVEFGYRPLANKIGMDHTRLRRCLLGGGTSAETVQKVADAFGVDPGRVRELRGEGRDAAVEPFTLPDDAGRLTHDERNVIRSMVRALLDARDRHVTQPTDTPAEEQGASSSPHTDEKAQGDDKVTPLRRPDQARKPERPEDAKAARKRNPRFKPQDPDESH